METEIVEGNVQKLIANSYSDKNNGRAVCSIRVIVFEKEIYQLNE